MSTTPDPKDATRSRAGASPAGPGGATAVSQAVAGAVAPPRARRGIVWNDVLVTLASLVLALVVGALLMVFTDPAITAKWSYFFARPGDALSASGTKITSAYGALASGALGSWQAITQTTTMATPLICAGLGIALGFRAGLFNIGAQGQAIWGATLAAWVGFNFHQLPLALHMPLAVLAGIVGGAVWAGIAGVLKARTGAHEVIVTIMLNYIATGLLAWLLTTHAFMTPGRADPIAPQIDWSATLPRLAGSNLNLGFFLALAAAAAVWWLLGHTRLGFTIRAVGANPHASATAGMSVARTTITTMLWAGGLAGLAGAMIAMSPSVAGTATPLTSDLVGSVGFDAITVALLGRSKPLGCVLAGLLFGALANGGLQMQSQAGTPMELTNVLQALIVMFVAAPMLVRTLVPFLKARARHAGGSAVEEAVPTQTAGGLSA